MKKVSITLLFLLIFLFPHSQVRVVDSLLKAAAMSKTDTGRMFTYERLAANLMYTSTDSALKYAEQAYALALKINFKKGEAQSLAIIGNTYFIKGLYPKSIESHLKALRVHEQLNNLSGVAAAYNNIALVYEQEEKYTKAIGNYVKAKNIFEKLKSSDTSQNIQAEMNDYLLITLSNIGNDYETINNLDSALFFLSKAYDLAKRMNDQFTIGTILRNFGNVKRKQNNTVEALRYYRASILYSEIINDHQILADVNKEIATIKNLKGERDSALIYARRSYINADLVAYLAGKENAALLLLALYDSAHQSDSALKYLKISAQIKDSISSNDVLRKLQEMDYTEQLLQQEKKAAAQQYNANLKMYLLGSVLTFVLLISGFLFRNNRLKQKTNLLLITEKNRTEQAFKELKSTQSQLIQSEKMASLGELTAGIAHEIQNPLNFVNNFSEVNIELIDELEQEADKGNFDEIKAIAKDIRENEQKVNHHGKRADAIVKGMLQHSRTSTGQKELTDINALADEYLRLSYHGFRAKDKTFNATLQTDFDKSIDKINIIPQEIGRVLLNLYNNAFYAVAEKKHQHPVNYEPTISVRTKRINDKVEVRVKDNGSGIPQKVADKIFQPFFTTKPTGQGTGLGLSLAYDIIKAHAGEIKVESKEGEGSEFRIILL